MNKDLFLAILSLDTYNRGYAKGVVVSGSRDGLDLGEPSRQIGNATILSQDISDAAVNAGFYALSYKINDNSVAGLAKDSTVIAYRGSDYEDTNGIGLAQLLYGNDIWKGWRAGFGFPFGGQPALALDFYQAVTHQSPYNTPGTVTLTGHSLGGELAGYVSALSGNPALLFDNLPFGFAAYLESLAVTGTISTVKPGLPTGYYRAPRIMALSG